MVDMIVKRDGQGNPTLIRTQHFTKEIYYDYETDMGNDGTKDILTKFIRATTGWVGIDYKTTNIYICPEKIFLSTGDSVKWRDYSFEIKDDVATVLYRDGALSIEKPIEWDDELIRIFDRYLKRVLKEFDKKNYPHHIKQEVYDKFKDLKVGKTITGRDIIYNPGEKLKYISVDM